jgi:hypothetical protein
MLSWSGVRVYGILHAWQVSEEPPLVPGMLRMLAYNRCSEAEGPLLAAVQNPSSCAALMTDYQSADVHAGERKSELLDILRLSPQRARVIAA